ncbi:MAG: hypothetical protein IRY85_14775 [Micromonosporaceae bacterium]|nr:hypothetical protein [Micromonosporaceae bacterium]
MVSITATLDALSPRVADFLRAYQAASTASGADRLTDLFLPTFLNVDPNNATAVPTGVLVRALPARERLFTDAGVTGLTLESATETWLDDQHVVVHTTWRLLHPRATDATPPTRSTFLLVDDGGALRVAAYINLTDLPALLAQVAAQ